MTERGMIIGGKYEILNEIGEGGMSVVYLAKDKNLGKLWAVKEVRHDVYGEEREVIVKSFLTEANLMKKLDHPTLPRIVDIIDQNYVVMDYMEGESLDKVLDKCGAQNQDSVIEWGKTLCEVLVYLHTRVPPIIYRDMKPSNIMLRDGHVRLFDFGIAREYKQENLADTTHLGTRGYAAPEQFGKEEQTDARTDVYGLGMTLHHLVTGKSPMEPPYEVYPIRHWNPALSSGLEWIIQKSTQLNPAHRFQSSEEMLYALENVERYSNEYVERQKRKVRMFSGVMIAAAVFLAVGFGGTAAHIGVQNQSYEVNLYEGTTEGYKRAIELNPGRADAYLAWINLYIGKETDESGTVLRQYTAEEADKMESVFDRESLERLRKTEPEAYAEVCYRVGWLNWYLYSTGEEADDSIEGQEVRIIRSIKWFQRVKELNEETNGELYLSDVERACADCYYNIGDFFQKKELAEIGGSEKENVYKDYFENVMELIEKLELDKPQDPDVDKSQDGLMRVQIYDLIIYSLDSDVTLFKNQGVTKSEAQQLYDIAAVNTQKLEALGDRGEAIKEHILERLDSVQKKINMAYDGKENADG